MSIKDLISKITPQPVAIEIPSWGGAKVYILPPSRGVLDAHDETIKGEGEDAKVRGIYELVAECLCEEDGTPAYADADAFEDATEHVPFDGITEIYQCIVSRQLREISKVKGAEKNSTTRRKG